ncbi:putative act-like protein [Golovinomyces cichoracearum]|uniref:Putative act-like protein n=1 Tax=Golovinomyces cichoracearum TaxID=62708 RepID=A0A420IG71_9PEZI|nr:putative act-like protein [Golovinomyces cichoracearum]
MHNFVATSVTSMVYSIMQLSAYRDDKPLNYPENYTAFKMCTVGTDAGQIIIEMTTPLLIEGPVYLIAICSAEIFLICSTDREATIPKSAEYCFSFLDSKSAYLPPAYNTCRLELSSYQVSSSLLSSGFVLKKTLKKHVVVPSVDQGLILMMFSGCKAPSSRYRHSSECCPVHPKSSHAVSTWLSKTIRAFYTAPISALVNLPRFLSVTFALYDVPSLLIDEKRLRIFSDSVKGILKRFSLLSLFLYQSFEQRMTGFVCGVASLLVQELCRINAENVYKMAELSFISEYGERRSCSLGRKS